MYKIISDNLPELKKRIKSITKKLDKYNLMYEFKLHEPVIESVDVFNVDPETKISTKIGSRLVEVIPYEFWMEPLVIGEWTPIALIEHDAVIEGATTKNMVHSINNHDIDEHWWTIKSNCEHCRSQRYRSKTIMLEDSEGNLKQVGSTCIKSFTGIEANDVISLYATVDDIYVEEIIEVVKNNKVIPSRYMPTVSYLAASIQLIEETDYVKDSTKFQASERVHKGDIPDRYIKAAEDIINYFKTLDMDKIKVPAQSFYSNIINAVSQPYTKRNGLVAYAPVAYKKLLESIAEVNTIREASKSKYQGQVKDKIELLVTLSEQIRYEGVYGTSYVYIFEDSEGNIYKWNTQIELACIGKSGTLKGTIKDHIEYDGVQQTVIFRCKFIV